MSDANESPQMWLAKKYFDECSVQFRAVWDLYLKFYVVFLTVNVTALGLTVENVHLRRAKAVIAIAFIMQNAFAGVTAARIAQYSPRVAARAKDFGVFIAASDSSPEPGLTPLTALLKVSPIPGGLGWWGGIANCLGHIVSGILWIVVIFVDFPQSTSALH